jgi:N-acetylmuramoyl-L-alanine amidase
MNFQKLFRAGFIVSCALISLECDRAMAQFSHQELNSASVVAIASPYQNGERHQLLILEQLANTRLCWSEQKTETFTAINPLLLEFDFSKICGRATDSNGFSIRMGNRDFGWLYALQIIEKDDDLLLIARSTVKRKPLPDLLIGRVGGITDSFGKIALEPGWRLTRRSVEGQLTGHYYLTHDLTVEEVASSMTRTPTTAPSKTQVFSGAKSAPAR